MNGCVKTVLLAVLLVALSGCAGYPLNPQLTRHDPGAGYRFGNLESAGNSDSLFVILTFSGGGTRAAALSYGVMEKLRDTKIYWEGRQRRLLDEVDVISSVSGGSFTAAYYGLFRDELFDARKFEKVFLYRNIEAELIGSVVNPANWLRLAAPTFGRIDLAAEFYDREIFRGKRYSDLIAQARRPYLMINATDITMGSQFTFVQDQFDLICSDLAGVSVGRAVAASSDYPIAFTPLILNNYAGSCGYQEPEWVAAASKDLIANPPRYNRARIARSYGNSKERAYIHLLDGGVADNIGLRGPLVAIQSNDPRWNLPNMINIGKVRKIVVIVVDARTAPKSKIDNQPNGPGLAAIVDTIASVPMANYSFDTVQELLETFRQWERDRLGYAACKAILENQCPAAHMPANPPRPIDTYAIYVGFDQLQDPSEKERFLDLSTTFYLPEDQVNALRKIGPRILDESAQFQRLLRDLATPQ
jgi:predicted acylesterase/phospholipase RssA